MLFLPVGDFRECGFVELHHRQSAGGRPSQKAYLRALGKKAAGLGQHRPRSQHAVAEFLEEPPHLTMVLAGTIQHRDERTRVNENAFRNERPLPYLAHAASRTTHRRYDRSLPERGSPASGRHPSSNRASARRSGNLRNPQRDLSVLLPRRAEPPHRGSRGAGGGAQRAKAPRPFLDERSDIEGVPVRTLNLEGLLKTKQAPRDKDRLDREVLERALAELKKSDAR